MLVQSFAITVFLFVAVIVHVVFYKEELGDLSLLSDCTYQRDELDYCLWLALGALVLAAIDTVLAGFSV